MSRSCESATGQKGQPDWIHKSIFDGLFKHLEWLVLDGGFWIGSELNMEGFNRIQMKLESTRKRT
jgi:hypothetical protein